MSSDLPELLSISDRIAMIHEQVPDAEVLIMPDIDGKNVPRPAVQQHFREPSRRGPNVDCGSILDDHREVIQGIIEFQPAPTDPRPGLYVNDDFGLGSDAPIILYFDDISHQENRALVKKLDGISEEDIVGLNIPTGIPLVYELDAEMKPLSSRYLGDAEAARAAADAVSKQAG